ncbi:MAG: 30S ribosomal protein S6 [Planctomycetota bacterium]
MKNYEGMFLIDTKEAKKGSEAIEGTIKGLIEKCKGQVIRFEKWDECRLAYEINGVINGTYYLYYFSGETDTIKTLNREIQLSSKVLRALFLRVKEVPEFIAPSRAGASDDEDINRDIDDEDDVDLSGDDLDAGDDSDMDDSETDYDRR